MIEAPDPRTVSALIVGDVLELRLIDGRTPTISANTLAGNEAGAIVPDRALVDCMRRGVEFVAIVTRVAGLQVLTKVEAR